MTLQYAKELLIIEAAQVLENKDKKIATLEIENQMLRSQIQMYERMLSEQNKQTNEDAMRISNED